jgi:hypothetical protein
MLEAGKPLQTIRQFLQGDAHTLYRQNEREGDEFQLKNTPVE